MAASKERARASAAEPPSRSSISRERQPAIRAVAVGGGRRLPASQQVGQERLDLLPVSLGEVDAMASQTCLEQADGLQVGLDRAVRLVLGPEMPLEGAGQVG
jgi:hypothetical protein